MYNTCTTQTKHKIILTTDSHLKPTYHNITKKTLVALVMEVNTILILENHLNTSYQIHTHRITNNGSQ